MNSASVHRRRFLSLSTGSLGAFFLGAQGCSTSAQTAAVSPLFADVSELADLLPPDENGVRLPPGFRSRIVARSSDKVADSDYSWHAAPDGGACFAMDDGGWIYVSNSEIRFYGGGVGAIRFDRHGNIIDSYPILENTHQNCAGGKTPWQTWLSCEEVDRGLVYECYPDGSQPAQVLPALGRFRHEAVAVDPVHGHLYLTEDEPDGRLYRFKPENPLPDLRRGTLEVAEVFTENGSERIRWHPLNDPYASFRQTREQVEESTPFKGGEGIVWSEGSLYFTTKGDNKVWALETDSQKLFTLYDITTSPTPILSGVDNVAITASGDVLVAEDGGDMQLVLLGLNGGVMPVMQISGHDGSEITGPAFSPDYTRLYFSSQRGSQGRSENGITFEISRI